ncbi:MAG: hypothetical protein HY401_03325 [Elusimicrobia bacterium]|nr:hypothetical protein [Elusimicrobiota bacterium]
MRKTPGTTLFLRPFPFLFLPTTYYLLPTIYLLSTISFPQSAWSHLPAGGPYSHIDAYFSTGNTFSGPSGCIDPTVNFDSVPLNASVIGTAPAIEFNGFSGTTLDPKTKVLFIVRNRRWEGLTHANISDATFTIKRRVLKGTPPTLQTEDVRVYSFPNISIGGSTVNVCAAWDGSFAVDEVGFGKMNATFEVTAKLLFKSTDTQLEVNLQYPGEDQQPVITNVMDIHSVVSSPTVTGSLAGIPILVNYKLSKSANVAIDIYKGSDGSCQPDVDEGTGSDGAPDEHVVARDGAGCSASWLSGGNFVRRLVDNQPRFGEDTTQGKLGLVESWDGRDNDGNLVSTGTYVFHILAWDPDGVAGTETTTGGDNNHSHDVDIASFTVALDALQIGNLNIQGLSTQSTSFAGIGFQMTMPASVRFSIWQTTATFDVNASPPFVGSCSGNSEILSGTDVCPTNGARRVRAFQNTFLAQTSASIIWDGRDSNGAPMDDGSYMMTIWAAEAESAPVTSTGVIKTAKPIVAVIPIARGLVPISQVTTQSAAFSSPAITAVAPYNFNYSLGRDAVVNLKVKAINGQVVSRMPGFTIASEGIVNGVCTNAGGCTVAHLVLSDVRSGGVSITDPASGWDGRVVGLPSFNGIRVSSGVYLAELAAQDTLFTSRITTITSLFAANMLRIAQVTTTPLLSGSTDSATISYALSEPMSIRWEIYTPTASFSGNWPNLVLQTGKLIRTIFGARPGRLKITEFWDGRDESGLFVEDGDYVTLFKSSDSYGNVATDQVIRQLTVARGQVQIINAEVVPTFPTLEDSSDTLNVPLEPYEISYTLSRDAVVTIDIKDIAGTLIKRLVDGEPRLGLIPLSEFWDGTNFAETRLTTGTFFVDIVAQDQASVNTSTSVARIPLSVDLLRVYDVAVTPLAEGVDSAEITYQLSEPMNVDIKIFKPGTIFNLAGQAIPPESESLVFFIKGPRPSRVPITEFWPGINLFQKQVSDGNYVFRLVAKDNKGNPASNIEHGEVPVLRLAFVDPQATFDDQTFAYPNPATRTPVKIRTLVPIDADLNLKIYTLTGDLIWDRSLGRISGDQEVTVEWNLDNMWGRKVARGVYFYVLRADSVGGNRQFLQTMKKILVP